MRKLFNSNFFIRLRSWEYWPFGIIQFPVFIYWLWLSLKARSLLFFTASNPGIFMGGMFGESKVDVLKKIPEKFIARSTLVRYPAQVSDVLDTIVTHEFQFPMIFKPDIGERGFMVKKIRTAEDIEVYLETLNRDFIIQEYIDLPFECGIFYTRFPNEPQGKVTSVVTKEMLTVTGDGISALRHLILNKDRAKLQWEKLKDRYAEKLDWIPEKGKIITLNEIGNHSLGTKFLNGEFLINTKLSVLFDELSKQVEGFYFGRYDLRAASIDDLYAGNFKILELNGCGAEPAHIYEPGFPLTKALAVQFEHVKNMYTISVQNHRRGVNYVSFSEGYKVFREFRKVMK